MTVLYFLATIVLLVGIHEWGHFAMARVFGVGVRSFTIGFGRQFVSWTDPKTGTSWGVAPYPVGGYVGLLDEKNDADPTLASNVVGKPFVSAPLHAKILILLAGPAVNLIFAAFLYALLAYTAPPQALPILAAPPIGSAAQLSGLRAGDEIASVNEQSVATWRDVQMRLTQFKPSDSILETDSATKDVRSKDSVPGGMAALRMTTLGGASYLLRLPTLTTLSNKQSLEEQLGLRLLSQGLLVEMTLPDSPAQRAGLRQGDVVEAVNGVVVGHPSDLLNSIQAAQGAALNLTVLRGAERATASVTPSRDAQGVYKIGLQFVGKFKLSDQPVSALHAINDGVSTAYTASMLTLQALGQFLSHPLSSEQLAGPVGIAQTAKASADRGWSAVMAFVAGLSISVGVINLLPVPLLDGGQIVYHLLRKSTRLLNIPFKMVHANRISDIWMRVGILLILGLTAAAFFADFKRLYP